MCTADMSRLSIIMSTYCRNKPQRGCPNVFRRAMDSILGQTFGDFELVLIDDCSKDGTEEVCRSYAKADSRIRYFRAKKNSGLPARRYNDGMRLAKSDLFAFMFDDDKLYPDGVKFLMESIEGENRRCGMVYGLTNFVDESTRRACVIGGEWDYERLKRDKMFCILANLSVVVRRSVIDDVGGYDESLLFRRNCDWDLWVRAGGKHEVAAIPRLIGTAYQGYPDSIGQIVGMSRTFFDEVAAAQNDPGRRVRLQGEMGLPVDSVMEGYDV